METHYKPSRRQALRTETFRSGALYRSRNITEGVSFQNRRAYQQPYRVQKNLVQTSQAAIIADPVPFSIPIRYSAYNLNSDTNALKFVPRSGNLIRVVDSEEGEGGSYPILPTDARIRVRDQNIMTDKSVPPETFSVASPEASSFSSLSSTSSLSPSSSVESLQSPKKEEKPKEETDGMLSYPKPPPALPPMAASTGTATATATTGKLSSRNPFLDDDAYTGAVLSELVYASPESDKRKADPQLLQAGFKYVPKLSSKETAVYDDPINNIRYIAIRGTASAKDMATDISLAFNRLSTTTRYKEERQRVEQAIYDALAANPSTQIRIAGHSLGGTLTTQIVEDIIKKRPDLADKIGGYAYNEGASPFRGKCRGIGCTQTKHFRQEYDVVSFFRSKTDTQTIPGCKNPLSTHSISSITTASCQKPKK